MDRKNEIIKIISQSNKAISASNLAHQLGVSRQIIVGDVALLRASGHDIQATPRGYILNKEDTRFHQQIAVKHTESQTEDELNTIVDMGGEIEDVIIEHPIYGELKGNLRLKSRFDVQQFIDQVHHLHALSLSSLTDGVHLHTIYCDNEEVFNRIYQALDEKGYIMK